MPEVRYSAPMFELANINADCTCRSSPVAYSKAFFFV